MNSYTHLEREKSDANAKVAKLTAKFREQRGLATCMLETGCISAQLPRAPVSSPFFSHGVPIACAGACRRPWALCSPGTWEPRPPSRLLCLAAFERIRSAIVERRFVLRLLPKPALPGASLNQKKTLSSKTMSLTEAGSQAEKERTPKSPVLRPL